MTTKRKRVAMLVVVSTPDWMTAQQARREVRDGVEHGCEYVSGPGLREGTMRVRRVAPTRAPKQRAF